MKTRICPEHVPVPAIKLEAENAEDTKVLDLIVQHFHTEGLYFVGDKPVGVFLPISWAKPKFS